MYTYAQLAVEVGVNVQKGQHVVINASTDVRELVRLLAKHSYEKGAKNVTVNWQDDELSRLKYEMAPFEAFEEYPEWEAKGKEELAKKGAAFISVVSSDPDLLKAVHPVTLREGENLFCRHVGHEFVPALIHASRACPYMFFRQFNG